MYVASKRLAMKTIDLKLIAKEEPYKQLIQKFSANEKISGYENLIITTTMLLMENQKSYESEKNEIRAF